MPIYQVLWSVNIKFGLGAALAGPDPAEGIPTAMIPVMAIGIHKVDKESHLAVDAAKVNPAKPSKTHNKPTGLINR